MPRVLVPIADASEDIETSCITDVLVRAGVEVVTTSVMKKQGVTFARGLKVVADTLAEDESMDRYDAIMLPGGMPGAQHIRDSEAAVRLLEEAKGKGKLVGAICAAPCIVLSTIPGFLDGVKRITCFPKLQEKLQGNCPGATVEPASVVVFDGKILTSQGPGTAMAFALAAVSLLCDEAKSKELAGALLTEYHPVL
eukprot:TRINITY_DN60159_c0_g1_i1.p2 TRINITY_DN60159_c0_g1~~TRINITY_DN60159_c0_g1_i1.p2  ORF type:complete len:221 (+),score=90.45 TRINITY_DN60159_c0_g1_i1:76-663(+)